MKKNKINFKIILLIIILVFLIFLILIFRNFRNFGEIKLSKNDKDIFTISDIVVNDIKYGSKEKDVIKEFGKPNKTKEYNKMGYRYKDLSYKGMIITLREYYNDYIFIGANITSSKYKVSRRLKVGSNIKTVMKKYNIDNKLGSYLYGNYKYDELFDKSINNNIYMGIRTNSKISYYNRDIINDESSNELISTLTFEYKNGIVKRIIFSYDYK